MFILTFQKKYISLILFISLQGVGASKRAHFAVSPSMFYSINTKHQQPTRWVNDDDGYVWFVS